MHPRASANDILMHEFHHFLPTFPNPHKHLLRTDLPHHPYALFPRDEYLCASHTSKLGEGYAKKDGDRPLFDFGCMTAALLNTMWIESEWVVGTGSQGRRSRCNLAQPRNKAESYGITVQVDQRKNPAKQFKQRSSAPVSTAKSDSVLHTSASREKNEEKDPRPSVSEVETCTARWHDEESLKTIVTNEGRKLEVSREYERDSFKSRSGAERARSISRRPS
ncbi:hypothetical protein R3P38DRAFT_2795846 [Favolaschia claudopus]|uniref:Uncharacterized protein n=1 Tax=Favolaschia claudopus TaxID=2862362 RepID=A0AAW0A603_9AGAR